MKFSRFSILAVAALTCTAFAVSCESDDPSKAVAPFWADGDVDGSGAVEVLDATYIQQYLAELNVKYAIGTTVTG